MKKILLSIFVFTISLAAFAQRDMTLFGMDNLFQKRYLNPAIQPKAKLHIGLPVLSSTFVGVRNTGFGLGEVMTFNGESEVADNQSLMSSLDDVNTFGFQVDPDLFTLGFGVGKNYISLSVRERVSFDFNYSKGLAQFLTQGNGSSIGTPLLLDGTGIDLSAFLEMGLGFSRQVNDRLGVGATFKMVNGQLNIDTKGTTGSISTNSETYALRFQGQTTLRMNQIDLDADEIVDTDKIIEGIPTSENQGFGVDLGATYRLTNKLTLGAAILDLGAISWAEESSTVYENASFDFSYEGQDISDIFGSSDEEEGGAFEDILDSLQADLENSKVKKGYSTSLPTTILVSAAYNLTPKSEVGVTLRNFTTQETAKFAASAYYGVSLKDWLSASVSASYLNRSITNVGLGLMFRLGTFQFYGMADDLLGLVSPENSRGVQARFGMNLVFGGHRKMFDEVPQLEDKVKPETEIEEEPKKLKEDDEEPEMEEEDDDDSGLEFITPAELEKRKKEEAEKKAAEKEAQKKAKKESSKKEAEAPNALEKERQELEKAKAEEKQAEKEAKAKAKADAKAAKKKAKEDAKKAKEDAKAAAKAKKEAETEQNESQEGAE